MAIPTISQYPPKPVHREQQLRRGRIAVLEQLNIFSKMFTISGQPYVPQTRGEVAAQEQIRIFQHRMSHRAIQYREPKTRGEVAAQEQIRILSNILTSS